MTLFKSLFFRYSFFVGAKFLFTVRILILILSFSWLSIEDFSLLAIFLSFIEISRSLFDLGSEAIIYSKLSGFRKTINIFTCKLIKLRLFSSLVLTFILFIIMSYLNKFSYWPLLLLPIIEATQRSCVAFIQKDKVKSFLSTPFFLLVLISFGIIFITFKLQATSTLLFLLMITPELISTIIIIIFTLKYWVQVFNASKINFSFFKRIIPYLLPSAILSVTVMIYSRPDLTLIYPLLGPIEQTKYSVSMRGVDIIFSLLVLISSSLLAELGSKSNKSSKFEINRFYNLLSTFNVFLFFIITFFIAIILKFVLLKLFLNEEDIIFVAFLLFLTIPFKIINSLLSSCIYRLANFHYVMVASFRVLVLIFTLGVPLGYYFGLYGIVIAIAISEFYNLFYQKNKLKKLLK